MFMFSNYVISVSFTSVLIEKAAARADPSFQTVRRVSQKYKKIGHGL